MGKKKLMFISTILLTVLISGCTSVAPFDYASAPGTMPSFQLAGTATKSVAVIPFMDKRSTKYFDPMQASQAMLHPDGDHGSFYLGFIPFMPYGYVEKEEPENSVDFVSLGRFHFNVEQDLANASIASLKASNLFSSVTKANNAEQVNADYVWVGEVFNTYYRGDMISYGITYFFSPLLWAVGAPNGVSYNELWVKFSLIDVSTGAEVWSYNYRGSDYIVHWIYARIGQDVSLYPQLMKQAMNGALFDLSRRASTL